VGEEEDVELNEEFSFCGDFFPFAKLMAPKKRRGQFIYGILVGDTHADGIFQLLRLVAELIELVHLDGFVLLLLLLLRNVSPPVWLASMSVQSSPFFASSGGLQSSKVLAPPSGSLSSYRSPPPAGASEIMRSYDARSVDLLAVVEVAVDVVLLWARGAGERMIRSLPLEKMHFFLLALYASRPTLLCEVKEEVSFIKGENRLKRIRLNANRRMGYSPASTRAIKRERGLIGES